MSESELVLKDYRLKVNIRVRGKDYSVETEAKKVSSYENVGKRGSMYFISFGGIEINMGEDLTKEIVEILLYMLPEDVVQKMIEEYYNSKWV